MLLMLGNISQGLMKWGGKVAGWLGEFLRKTNEATEEQSGTSGNEEIMNGSGWRR